jgi:hypothetical protein
MVVSLISLVYQQRKEKAVCRWITFTSDADWKPYDDHFKDVETAMINHHVYPDPIHPHYDMEGNRLDGRTFKTLNTIAAYMPLYPSIDTFDLTYQHRHISATSSKDHRSTVSHDVLARRWGTSVNNAGETMKVTTQRGL